MLSKVKQPLSSSAEKSTFTIALSMLAGAVRKMIHAKAAKAIYPNNFLFINQTLSFIFNVDTKSGIISSGPSQQSLFYPKDLREFLFIRAQKRIAHQMPQINLHRLPVDKAIIGTDPLVQVNIALAHPVNNHLH